MSETAKKIKEEMIIDCPVCYEPRIFINGEITINRELSFFCFSKKCHGHRRYINKDHLKIIIDKFNKSSI